MLKKITTVIAQNKSGLRQKALVWGGITAGMLISAIITKSEPEVVVIEETQDDVVVETTSEPEENTPES